MLISKSSLFIFMEVNKSYFFIRHHFYKNSSRIPTGKCLDPHSFFPLFSQILQISAKISNFYEKTGKNLLEEPDEFPGFASPL